MEDQDELPERFIYNDKNTFRVFEDYIQYRSATGPMIESWNQMLIRLRSFILDTWIWTTDTGEFYIRDVKYKRPHVDNTSELLYPSDPRAVSYVGDIVLQLSYRNNSDKEEIIGNRQIKAHIPVMVRSCMCNLSGLDQKEIWEKNQNIHEPGGYFILGGVQKVIMTRQSLRLNTIMIIPITKVPFKGQVQAHYSSMSSELHRKIYIRRGKKGEYRVAFLKLNKNKHLSLVAVFMIMGIMTVADINLYLWQMVPDQYRSRFHINVASQFCKRFKLDGTIEENEKLLYHYVQLKYTEKKSSWEILRSEILGNIFVNIPSTESLECKRYMLAMMVVRLMLYYMGAIPMDERDNYANKRLEVGADAFYAQCTSVLNQYRQELDKSMTDYASFDHFELSIMDKMGSLTAAIVSMICGTHFGRQSNVNYDVDRTETMKSGDPLLQRQSLVLTVRIPMNRNTESTKAREVHPSQIGVIDAIQTPEGQRAGTVVHMTMVCHPSLERSPSDFLMYVKSFRCEKMFTTQPAIFPYIFLVNGVFYGWGTLELYRLSLHFKRQLMLGQYAAVVLRENECIIAVNTDAQRPMVPYFIINQERHVLQKIVFEEQYGRKIDSFQELLQMGAIEFLDPAEIDQRVLLAESEESIKKVVNENLTFIRCLEQKIEKEAMTSGMLEKNKAKLERWKQFICPTHLALDPSAYMSISAAMIPFPDYAAAGRNTFQSNMNRHTLSLSSGAGAGHFLPGKYLIYPSQPLFTSKIDELFGADDYPTGISLTVAIMPSPQNSEDGCIINAETAKFKLANVKTSVVKVKKQNNEVWGIPTRLSEKDMLKFNHIDPITHCAKIGTVLDEGMIVVAKYRPATGKTIFEDTSVIVPVGESGKVVAVYVNDNIQQLKNKEDTKHQRWVKIDKAREFQNGDKITMRAAQKMIGQVWPKEKMPRTADGRHVDLIVNPNAFCGRMTPNNMMEMYASKAILAADLNTFDATTNRPYDIELLQSLMTHYGFPVDGCEVLYVPDINGNLQPLCRPVFTGPVCVFALKHQTDDKINARGTVRKSWLTKQLVKGRKMRGGLRTGVMERTNMIAQGMSGFLADRMFTNSDEVRTFFCTRCSRFAYINSRIGPICPTLSCKGHLITLTTTGAALLLQEVFLIGGYLLQFRAKSIEDAVQPEETIDDDEDVLALNSDSDEEESESDFTDDDEDDQEMDISDNEGPEIDNA